jgi:hypothetical protein
LQQHGTGHGYQATYCADGNVDAAYDHNYAQTKCHDDERSVQVEQVKEGLKLHETVWKTYKGKPVHQYKYNPGYNKKKIRIR